MKHFKRIYLLVLMFWPLFGYCQKQDTAINAEIRNEAIEIRNKLNKYMSEKLSIDNLNGNNKASSESIIEQVFKTKFLLDSLIKVISNHETRIDSLENTFVLMSEFGVFNTRKARNFYKKNKLAKQGLPPIASEQLEKVDEIKVSKPTEITYNENVTEANSIYFDENVWKLNFMAQIKTDSIIATLKGKYILLVGYYDKNGSEKSNGYLAKRRVKDIKTYLLSKGIKEELIKIDYKRSCGIASNKFCRRVDFIFSN
jgi:outer membrane protein OmpA-like peptidoglycan-associated protein